ncbi:MAG: hypothetical protein NEHIOOID_00962 [Holosporales bacterium]
MLFPLLVDQATQTHDVQHLYQESSPSPQMAHTRDLYQPQLFFDKIFFTLQKKALDIFHSIPDEERYDTLIQKKEQLKHLKITWQSMIEQVKEDPLLHFFDEQARFMDNIEEALSNKIQLVHPHLHGVVLLHLEDSQHVHFLKNIYDQSFFQITKLDEKEMIYQRLSQLYCYFDYDKYMDWSFFSQDDDVHKIVFLLDVLLSLHEIEVFDFRRFFEEAWAFSSRVNINEKADSRLIFMAVRFVDSSISYMDVFKFLKKLPWQNATFFDQRCAIWEWEKLPPIFNEILDKLNIYDVHTITELLKISDVQKFEKIKKYINFALSVIPNIDTAEESTFLIKGYHDFVHFKHKIKSMFPADLCDDKGRLEKLFDDTPSLSPVLPCDDLSQVYQEKKVDVGHYMVNSYLSYFKNLLQSVFNDAFIYGVYTFVSLLKNFDYVIDERGIGFTNDGRDDLFLLDEYKKIAHLDADKDLANKLEKIMFDYFEFTVTAPDVIPARVYKTIGILNDLIQKNPNFEEDLVSFKTLDLRRFTTYEKALLFSWMQTHADLNFLKQGLDRFESFHMSIEDIPHTLSFYQKHCIYFSPTYEERFARCTNFFPNDEKEKKLFVCFLPLVPQDRLEIIFKTPILHSPVLHIPFAHIVAMAATMDQPIMQHFLSSHDGENHWKIWLENPCKNRLYASYMRSLFSFLESLPQ